MQRKAPRDLVPADDGRGWMTLFQSAVPEYAFQRDDPLPNNSTLARNWTVFACQTLIAADMGKMGVKLMQFSDADRIFVEVDSPSVSPFLRKPNHFQTWPKFMQSWMFSKLGNGNTYTLKGRDRSGDVNAGYVLDPWRVTPLIASDGSVYYRLHTDDLASVPEGEVVVPASEIIHDRMWCLFHPLIGISPLFACGLAAWGALTIQEQSKKFFANGSRPGGLLTTPGILLDPDLKRYKAEWETNYAGANAGRTAVLGNGLKYEVIRENAVQSELVAQLNMTAQMICAAYHVPGFKIGVGEMPTYANAGQLNQDYYDDCLQTQIEDVEELLDDGLALRQKGFNVKFDVGNLLRMDAMSQMDFVAKGIERAVFSPNKGRRRFNEPPVEGGNSPMIQQQNYSLEALAKRDAKPDPFASAAPTAPAPPVDPAAQAAKAAAANVLRFARFSEQLRKVA